MEVFVTFFNSIKNGRIDPNYYRPERLNFYKKFKSHNNIITMKEIILEGNYGILPPGDCYDENNPVTFIRATELKENLKIDFENALKVPIEYLKDRVVLKENDILLAVKGATIASNKCVAFVDRSLSMTIINGSIFRFQVKEGVIPKYVAHLLNSNIIKSQMRFNRVANNAVDYLDKNLIENILLPLPDNDIQMKIVQIMDDAYSKKKQKEDKSIKLFLDIDTFVLNELGILKPLKNVEKSFVINFDLLTARFDSYYYQPMFLDFLKSLDNSKYKTNNLGNLINCIINGFDYRNFSDSGTSYLKVSNIKPFKIDRTNVDFINISSHEIRKSIQLREGDILITRKGTFGVSTTLNEDSDEIICSEIFKIESKENINPHYLSAVLNSSIGQFQFDRIKIGTIMGSLSQEAVKSIRIPEPPLQKQNELARAVKSLLTESENLKKDSNKIIEKAKKEVENILFK